MITLLNKYTLHVLIFYHIQQILRNSGAELLDFSPLWMQLVHKLQFPFMNPLLTKGRVPPCACGLDAVECVGKGRVH